MFSNYNTEQHDMCLEKTHPSGAEEWYCPIFLRRVLMQWPPKYQKIVLEPGEEYALHSGSKGGLRMGPLQVSEADDEPVLSEELRAAIEEVLDKVDIDDWMSAQIGRA